MKRACALSASDFTKAEAEFRQAVEADPGSARAYNDLGAFLNNQQRDEEAFAAFQKALALNPSYDPAKKNLEMLKRNAAISLAQKAQSGNGAANPAPGASGQATGGAAADHLNAGLQFYRASNFTAAEAEFRQAIPGGPGLRPGI